MNGQPEHIQSDAFQPQSRQDLIATLERTLADWLVEPDVSGLPADRQEHIRTLARESAETLRTMIEKLKQMPPLDRTGGDGAAQ